MLWLRFNLNDDTRISSQSQNRKRKERKRKIGKRVKYKKWS